MTSTVEVVLGATTEIDNSDVVDTKELAELAAQINDAHRAALNAAGSALEHARRAGERLITAKEEVKKALGHGEWLRWLQRHCPEISARTAQGYVRLAKKWAELVAVGGATLSLRQALAVLAERPAEVAEDVEDHGDGGGDCDGGSGGVDEDEGTGDDAEDDGNDDEDEVEDVKVKLVFDPEAHREYRDTVAALKLTLGTKSDSQVVLESLRRTWGIWVE